MTWLIRRLLPANTTVDSVKGRQICGTFAGIIGICVNFLLFLGKLIVGTLSASLAITADAWNNLSDAGSSMISMVCFKMSAKPADRKHPFGHARMEYIASMIVSFFILLIGVELIRNSFGKIFSENTITVFRGVAVVMLIISIAVKCLLFFFYRRFARLIDSEALRASAADSLSDVLSTLAALVSMLVLYYINIDIDAYIGILVGIIIIINGIRTLNDTKNHILGTAPDPALVQEIVDLVKSHSEVLGVHDMMVHSYGIGQLFVTLHAEVDASQDVMISHDAIDNIERELYEKEHAIAVIHMDPIVTNDETVNELRIYVQKIAKALDERITVHDFRMVSGTTHTNLIFDMVLPYELAKTNEQVAMQMEQIVQADHPNYYCVITVERG